MAYLQGILPLYPVEKPPYTVEAPGYAPVPGETIPRRHPKAKNGLLTRPAPDVATNFDLLTRSAKTYPDEPAVGSRKLLKTHTELTKVPKVVDGQVQQVEKEWTFFELSDYTYLTYREYENLVLQVGAGLRKLGLSPHEKVHLFATTSANWLAMSHACSSQSMTIVTAYDTLGPSGVQHSLTQSSPSAIYTDPHLLPTLSSILTSTPSIRYLIYNDASNQPVPDSTVTSFKQSHPTLQILPFSALRLLGESHPILPTSPSPEDTYCIMYTSGSTGAPKGVPVTHASFVAAVAGVHAVVAETVSHADFVLAYLPLAHVFELVVENLVIFLGATLGYASARTLADNSVRRCAGDMRAFRPTVMVGVPQVWEGVRKGITARVDAGGVVTRGVFWGTYHVKWWLVRMGLPGAAGVLDSLVFGRVRDMTGGRLRFIVNGASGIADSTLVFMSMVVAPMISGYGLTETCGNGVLGSPLQWTPGAGGTLPASIEVKLVSLPELGYKTDQAVPQGEILVRGKPVLKGYYQNDEESRRAITADGWFRTGDIGEFGPEGHLRVVDRVKNLVKMQGGEYVALEKLEAVYRGARFVQNIMVEADSAHARPVAVVCPNEKALAEKAGELGVDEHEMHRHKEVRAAVLKELVRVGRQGGLAGIELVEGVLLVEDEWTPANGFVTATQKVNRRAIREKYKDDIKKTWKDSL